MLKKRYLKSRDAVQITFYTAEAINAESIALVGDFNDWDENATPMQQLKDGRFKVTVELEPDTAYEFRYLVDGEEWHNDWEADGYVPNPHGSDNCVVRT